MRRFFGAVWHWTDKLLPVAFWIGSISVFWVGFTLWQESQDNEDRIEQVVVEFAAEVNRSLRTDCELGNDRGLAIIRFWDRLVATFSNENTTPEQAARALAFRDQLIVDFPTVDCEQRGLVD